VACSCGVPSPCTLEPYRRDCLPKAVPSRDPDTHSRVRHDRIDDSGVITLRHAGRLHHIGIGRTHARTHVIVLVQDLDIRIVNATTGELLRELLPLLRLRRRPRHAIRHRNSQPRVLRRSPESAGQLRGQLTCGGSTASGG